MPRSARSASRLCWTSLLGAWLLAALPAAHAVPGVDEPPLPGPPRPLVLPAFEETTLPNGVRVIAVPRHGLPLVTVALHLQPGAAADPVGQAGLTALVADLRTRGAMVGDRRLDAAALAEAAETLGSSLSSGSGWGGSVISMSVARPLMGRAARLVAAATRYPLLDNDELELMKSQLLDGLKLRMADPGRLAGEVADRAWWGGSVYGQSMTAQSLQSMRRIDVLAAHQRQLRPRLATFVFSGDVTLADARRLAQRLLGDWKPLRDRPLPAGRDEPAAPSVPADVLVDLPGAGQSGVVVMAPLVPDGSADRTIAEVTTAVLGGGYSARLNRAVRIRRGLSYGAGAKDVLHPAGGVVLAVTQTKNATAAQAVQVMRDELTGVATNPPTSEELSARQATLVGSFAEGLETTGGLAGAVLGQVERGRPLSELATYATRVRAVTPAQVQSFARAHWSAAALRTVVVGDLQAAGEPLKAAAPDALVLTADQLDLDRASLQH